MKNKFLFAILACCLNVYSQPPEYSILGDIDFSPYAGGEDLLFATRLLERAEIYWLRKTNLDTSKDSAARSWRLSEMLTVWLPLNYEAMLIQHEVFGHGYRIRDMGKSRARVSGYSLHAPPPYGNGGGSTTYELTNQLTSTEQCTICSAGVEATAILANLTKFKWLTTRKIDARQSLLYLLSQHDLTFYIGTIKEVRSDPSIDFSGHDIDSYLFWLNFTYPDAHLSSSRLRTLSLINWLDPFTVYSIWACLHFIGSGRDTKIPMIKAWDLGYLFGARLGLTPFGPEFFWENYFAAKDKMFYGYLKAGNHANNSYVGAGLFLPVLWRIKKWDLGTRIDLWRQPKLLLHPGSILITNINKSDRPSTKYPLYPSSERHKISNGFGLSLVIVYHWNKTYGIEGEFGGKTQGFLPGYSLWAAATIRGGFTAKF